jgi:hypothetical protein
LTPTNRPKDSGPAGPAPAATTAPNAWAVLSTSFRVEQTTLVVSGTIEIRRASQTVYVDVQAFNGAGQGAGQGDAPVFPSPGPAGGTATFEARIAIDQVVRRYTVTIRPIGSLSAVLAQHMAEITTFKAFGAIIARDVRAELRAPASGHPRRPLCRSDQSQLVHPDQRDRPHRIE